MLETGMNYQNISISYEKETMLDEINLDDTIIFIQNVLTAAEEQDTEVSISFIEDNEMQQLNMQYRGINKPTDVLSFALRESEGFVSSKTLGDIVISFQTASRQAAEFEHSLQVEIYELIFHGMLHLMGFDHETNRDEWIACEQKYIQSLINIDSIYIPLGMNLDGSL